MKQWMSCQINTIICINSGNSLFASRASLLASRTLLAGALVLASRAFLAGTLLAGAFLAGAFLAGALLVVCPI